MELTLKKFLPEVPAQVLQDLKVLAVPVRLSGYQCLCIAIAAFARDISQSMCNELYPAVAAELGYVDWRAVEFAIRRAILAAWERRDEAVWEQYFPGCTKAPTNKQFIATLAMRSM